MKGSQRFKLDIHLIKSLQKNSTLQVEGMLLIPLPISLGCYGSTKSSVPPGLIAAGIVSAWTWAATLLQSSATAYKFGISGPWWYASGACIQGQYISSTHTTN